MVIPAPLNVDEQKAADDFSYLLDAFRDVLVDLGEAEIAAALPWGDRHDPSAEPDDPDRLTQALSIAFRLATLSEENAAAQFRKSRESADGLAAVSGSWGRILSDLREAGHEPAAIATQLGRIVVEPVLTAHPTEAKRATVLEQHRALYLLLVSREKRTWTPAEEVETDADLRAMLERLWRTGEIFLERPDIADEFRNVAHYLVRVFPKVVSRLDGRLRSAWVAAGFDPELLTGAALPQLRFGTWVGGDRDGHPFVTADVTERSLRSLRERAVTLLDDELAGLATRLSLSDLIDPAPSELISWIDATATALGPAGARSVERNPDEPWRQAINLIRARLPRDVAGGDADPPSAAYLDAGELVDDLRRVSRLLDESGPGGWHTTTSHPVIRSTETFGFHLAARHPAEQPVPRPRRRTAPGRRRASRTANRSRSGTSRSGSRCWSASWPRRVRSPPPTSPIGAEADAVLSCYRVLRDEIRSHGAAGLGSLIVSMTRERVGPARRLPARQGSGPAVAGGRRVSVPAAGRAPVRDDRRPRSEPGDPAGIPRPPDHPAHARRTGHRTGDHRPSRSWSATATATRTAASWPACGACTAPRKRSPGSAGDAGVAVSFFHGRGGTISRGAGPTHRFLRALPPGSMTGPSASPSRARRSRRSTPTGSPPSTTSSCCWRARPARPSERRRPARRAHHLEPLMDQLAASSRAAYADLLHTDRFIEFFRQATPIDVIERSRIGSRPARRTGRASIADLRAIPWVFAWSQSRFLLSGWFGLGTALADLRARDDGRFHELVGHVFDWPPLHYIVSNAATTIATADAEIMGWYAAMVANDDVRARFLDRIHAEYSRTTEVLEEIYGGPLRDRRPNIARTLLQRDPALRPLHRRQIELIAAWRTRQAEDPASAESMLPQLLVTVNAIASGLGATG